MKLLKQTHNDWYTGKEISYTYKDYTFINIGNGWEITKNYNAIKTFKTLKLAKEYLINNLK